MGDIVYGYFKADVPPNKVRQLPDGGVGYICVRLDRPPKDSDSRQYKASFSFCSPIDAVKYKGGPNKEYKALARKIANDRMNTRRVNAHVEFEFGDEGKLPDVFSFALNKAKATQKDEEHTFAPEWVQVASVSYGLR